MTTVAATAAGSVLDHIGRGADLIVPLANGEPVALLDAIEAARRPARRRARPPDARACTTGRTCTARSAIACATSRTSCRTSPGRAFAAGTIDLVPNNFSEMRDILSDRTTDPLVLAAASPPDRHGYFSLGSTPTTSPRSSAGPASSSRPTPRMPRTFGRNQIHISQVVGWSEAD